MNQPFDLRDQLGTFGEQLADLGAWLNRGEPAQPVSPPTFRDDLRDLWTEIAANPTSHAVVGVFGFIAGVFLFLIPAYVWSLFI